MKNYIEILKMFVGDETSKWSKHIYWNGFVFATNGHILIRIEDNSIDANLPDFAECLRTFVFLNGGQDISIEELKECISSVIPITEKVYKKIECNECKGGGVVECECFDCGNEHNTECKRCEGEGEIKTKEIIGEKEIGTPTSFSGLYLNYYYIKKIITAMEHFQGKWTTVVTEIHKPVYFNTDKVTIVVMPMAYGGV